MSQPSDNREPRPQLIISAHERGITRLVYLPDGRLVTTCSEGVVKVWDLEKQEQEGTPMELNGGWSRLAVTRDGTKIIGGTNYGRKIKVFNVESHELVKEWTHGEVFSVIAISPDDRVVAVGNRRVVFYTVEGKQIDGAIEVSENSFSPDGSQLARGDRRGEIFVYDVKSRTTILGPLKGHRFEVSCLLWSRDGSRFFSASHGKTIRCWNSATGAQIGQPSKGHTGTSWITSLSLSPDGQILASASSDQSVRFWDAVSGRPIGHLFDMMDWS